MTRSIHACYLSKLIDSCPVLFFKKIKPNIYPKFNEIALKSVEYIKRKQNKNGSWGYGGFKAYLTAFSVIALNAVVEGPIDMLYEKIIELADKGISFQIITRRRDYKGSKGKNSKKCP